MRLQCYSILKMNLSTLEVESILLSTRTPRTNAIIRLKRLEHETMQTDLRAVKGQSPSNRIFCMVRNTIDCTQHGIVPTPTDVDRYLHTHQHLISK